VWPPGVVVFDPLSDGLARMLETEEQGFIQEFVPHLAIEAFDITVRHWLTGRDVVPIDLVIPTPGEDSVRSELGAIAPTEEAGLVRRNSGARSP
jgi:hypothetical protein